MDESLAKPSWLRLSAAVFYAMSSVLIVMVNKSVLTNYK